MTACQWCGKPMTRSARYPNCSGHCGAMTNWTRWRVRNSEVDPMAVVRLTTGHPVQSTQAERIAAVATLTARGESAAGIAGMLRVTERTVTRYRALIKSATTRRAAA